MSHDGYCEPRIADWVSGKTNGGSKPQKGHQWGCKQQNNGKSSKQNGGFTNQQDMEMFCNESGKVLKTCCTQKRPASKMRRLQFSSPTIFTQTDLIQSLKHGSILTNPSRSVTVSRSLQDFTQPQLMET